MSTNYINPSPSGDTEGGRFSIIIPHKGPQWQLDRCIESIPQRDDLQTIVIRDEDGYGAGWARNQGLDKAEGKYVIFADSDDFFHPCFNDFLDSIKEETADVIYFNADSIEMGSGKPSWRTNHLSRIMSSTDSAWQERHLRYHFTEPWCKAIRMSFIKEHGIRFNESKILNDIYFSTQVGIFAKSIKVYTEKCYCVCNHSDSTAKSKKTEEKMLDYTRETAKSNLLLAQYGIKRYHSRMLRPMMTSLSHLRLRSACKCWKEMRKCGYSSPILLYYMARYPRDLMKLIIRKAQAGEIF
jgi:glycosyltransferase involved in cell wall biosynthesis